MVDEVEKRADEEEEGRFSELIRFTIPGYLVGIMLGLVLDGFGLQTSGVGQWLVRTVAGEGETLFEGAYALRQRLRRRIPSMAEVYGWGKLMGMLVPWLVDWGSRGLGVDVYGVESFYIPFLYGMADQVGANISGFVHLRRREGEWILALRAYLRHPVMVSSLLVVLFVPVGLLLARWLGFSPQTQLLTALEVIAANLCWVPPVVGSVAEARGRKADERSPNL
jgi:hypothetical protein